ncbi:D-alanine--D-alanine ligase [Helicobacter muridarum]|uniref:D-alanine--D-alanine ligase n=1 Tax=Helicobacter muridarum TaxID=216 RepID=A0A099TY40_9HELI|nr:D-alanine--D-alanine ligase [Helicobacter muridarum]TLE00078.1 D-alanine--D-alanine ligase [Helicobacter muridarum]STQ86073.1 D-alanyl-alanine synthetase A [Helicobacter muridarum]
MRLSVVFGGISYEHEISIVSAIALYQKLKTKIEYYIFLDYNHNFYLIESSNMKSKYFSSGDYTKSQQIDIGKNGFYTKGILGKRKLLDIGVLLNLIHGADGEDGVLAGLFEFYDIPFIGPRIEASTISYNKHLTKLYANRIGIATLPFILHRMSENLPNIQDFPVIVKPARLGSSIGITVVQDRNNLEYALDVAYEFDDELIIETFISGIKEYNIAGAKIDNEFILSIIEEPSKKDLLDFNDKYLDFSRTQKIVSAQISPSIEHDIKSAFKKIYSHVFEGALIRCDFFMHNDKLYLNEINPVPGSMANYLFEDFWSVIEKLCLGLPTKKKIINNYQYIDRIHHAKGK